MSDVALGTRRGVISGAAAVVVVPLGAMVATHGTKYIPLVMFLCAIFEGLFGVFKLAKLTRFISESVLNGFLNGLGGLLFMSQLKVFTSAPAFVPAVTCAAICATITELLPRIKSMPKSLKAVPPWPVPAFSTVQFGPSLTILKRAFGQALPAPTPAPGMPAEPPPLVALVSLAVTSSLCYAGDMASGIVAGVVLERVLGAIGGLFSGTKPATA